MTKTVTSIDQSKVLAKILPTESADIVYIVTATDDNGDYLYTAEIKSEIIMDDDKDNIPAWSLSALLNVLPPIQELCSSTDHYFRIMCMNFVSEWHDNAVDACVEMIEKLHKKGLL